MSKLVRVKRLVMVKVECPNCRASGLVINSNCHEGTAMICDKCNGKGYLKFAYKAFKRKKEVTGIKRIFKHVDGKLTELYPDGFAFINGEVLDFSKYGCTLKEFRDGKEPKSLL